jgi:thymidylate synthase (FAD)
MEVRFFDKPETTWHTSYNNIVMQMMDYPRGNFRERCVEMMKATWSDKPFNCNKDGLDFTEFKKILQMKVLPNSLESLNFTFRVEGLTLIEVTHLLRHRMLKAIHAQCSADRFLQKDSCFIPHSIGESKFSAKYKKITEDAKQLYYEMVNSGEVSILDARYILTRNHRYFYYFTIDLKTAIQFIHQRKCTQIQPEMDNIIAHYMHDLISAKIPELKSVVSLKCDSRCVYVRSAAEDSSRVYCPDKNHHSLIDAHDEGHSTRLDRDYYLHRKTRKEMNVLYNPQDK